MTPLFRLLRLFAPETPRLTLGFLVALLTLALGFALLACASLLAVARQSEAITSLVASLGGLATLFVTVRLLALTRTVSRYCERLVTHAAMFRVIARLRIWFFKKAIPLAPGKLGFSRSGDLLNRVTADIDALDSLYLRILIPISLLASVIIAGGFLLAPLSLLLAVSIAFILVLFAGLVAKISLGRKAREASTAMADQLADVRIYALDGMSGMADTLANDAAHIQQSTLAHATARLTHSQLTLARATALNTALTALTLGALTLAILFLAPKLFMIPLVIGLGILAEPLQQIPTAFLRLGHTAKSAERVLDIATRPPATREPLSPKPFPAEETTLCFDHVSLQYDTRTTHSLEDICFTLNKGERVLLCGASGAGKSSIVTLLLKFHEPTQGHITLGGIDLQDLDGDTLRRHIAYLSQQTNLLCGTVRDNLRLANPTASEADILAAINAAELSDTLKSLAQGLDTWIGEGGLLLSGGQARRLAVAQIILKGAPLWILDEPTEGLDDATATALLTTLARLSEGRTVLFITHRPDLASAMNLTRTLSMENGRIRWDAANNLGDNLTR